MKQIERIAFAGAGNVALEMARGLNAAGLTITHYYVRTERDDLYISPECSVPCTTSLQELAEGNPQLILIAVSDNSIAAVADDLAILELPMAHTSGSAVLGAGYEGVGVFYPLQTIRRNTPPDWRSVPLCIHASDPAFAGKLRILANRLSDRVFEIEEEDRRWLHLSAVLLNNNINHLLARVADLMESRGLPLTLLQPLLEETVRKAAEGHPADHQTGPAVRGDLSTRATHLEMLKSFGDDELIRLYDYFWRSIESYHKT